MSFNFGTLATTQAVSNNQPRLKPWGIYKVKFSGASKQSFAGKKDPSQSYDVLRVRFDGDEGYYEESIFFPKDGDDKRPTYTGQTGHEYEGASQFERTMAFIAQVATVLNPEGFKKMQEISPKFKSFDDVVTAFIKITDPCKGKETKIKLAGGTRDGQVVARLPKFVAVNKQGEVFTCDNFLGDNVFFSAYEEQKVKEYHSATPTDMADSPMDEMAQTVDGESAEEPMDFEGLL